MKVTVLMSVYNGEKYLRPAIESILNQTFKDFEFLIINDASTDSSKEIILSYHDPRIKLIDNEKNLGLTKSLNIGAKLAQGEHIARMDDDDWSFPERLEKQVEFMEKNKRYILIGGNIEIMDENGKTLSRYFYPETDRAIRTSLAAKNCFAHGSAMFRRDLFLAAGGYDETFKYSQDYELWTRMMELGKARNIPEIIYKWRSSPKSIGTLNLSEQTKNAESVRERYFRANNFFGLMPLIRWQNIKSWKFSKNDRHYREKMTCLAFFHQEFGRIYLKEGKRLMAELHFFSAEKILKKSNKDLLLYCIYKFISPKSLEKFLNSKAIKFFKKS